jgi:hypothetical protein
VHIFLVISQPVVVGSWCTFCLVAAAIMLPMIPLQVDEVIAMAQHMVQARRRGESLWTVFWKGGSPEGSEPDERTPEMAPLPDQPAAVVQASVWAMGLPWTLALSTALGIWLMFSPRLFGFTGLASDVTHLAGALIVVSSVIAAGEPLRAGRFLNGLLGIGILALPWAVSGMSPAATWSSFVVGAAVVALCFPRGSVRERYGGWDRVVF